MKNINNKDFFISIIYLFQMSSYIIIATNKRYVKNNITYENNIKYCKWTKKKNLMIKWLNDFKN